MNYLSVCSGIEAATVAWHHMGWKPVGYSEIEKFPSQVLAHHYPQVPNFGDMTKYKEWNINDTVGLLVGGTPCQSFSVAGLRKGLEDPRGNLALTYCGILDHFRPKWFVWENVPGVLSSNKGRDFGSFLGALVELGYGFSYRVLDAQYFGVAQRRRRVFVVGHLGDWRPTAKVLFESESLCRDIKPSRKKGERPSILVKEVAGTLCARDYKGLNSDDLTDGKAILTHAFKVRGGSGNGGKGYLGQDEKAFTLSTVQDQQIAVEKIIAPTLTTNDPSRSPRATEVTNQIAAVYEASMAVRRLTPVECERLQGFPDNYTNIKDNCPDGPRYKALGNSMAVPVMKWIGTRIDEYERGISA